MRLHIEFDFFHHCFYFPLKLIDSSWSSEPMNNANVSTSTTQISAKPFRSFVSLTLGAEISISKLLHKQNTAIYSSASINETRFTISINADYKPEKPDEHKRLLIYGFPYKRVYLKSCSTILRKYWRIFPVLFLWI